MKINLDLEFGINIILHILILLILLTILFWIVIKNISEKAITGEVSDGIDNSFDKLKSNLSQDEKNTLKNISLKYNNTLNYLSTLYSNPDGKKILNNKWLLENNILYIVIVSITLIVLLLTLKIICDMNTSFGKILLENILVFIFIGIIETIFFFKIALKFIPVKPSLIYTELIKDIKSS